MKFNRENVEWLVSSLLKQLEEQASVNEKEQEQLEPHSWKWDHKVGERLGLATSIGATKGTLESIRKME